MKNVCRVADMTDTKDIARHVHMTDARSYQAFIASFTGKIQDHNSAIPQGQEQRYVEMTRDEWNLLKSKRSHLLFLIKSLSAKPGMLVHGFLPISPLDFVLPRVVVTEL